MRGMEHRLRDWFVCYQEKSAEVDPQTIHQANPQEHVSNVNQRLGLSLQTLYNPRNLKWGFTSLFWPMCKCKSGGCHFVCHIMTYCILNCFSSNSAFTHCNTFTARKHKIYYCITIFSRFILSFFINAKYITYNRAFQPAASGSCTWSLRGNFVWPTKAKTSMYLLNQRNNKTIIYYILFNWSTFVAKMMSLMTHLTGVQPAVELSWKAVTLNQGLY